jgi:hypothetical protein
MAGSTRHEAYTLPEMPAPLFPNIRLLSLVERSTISYDWCTRNEKKKLENMQVHSVYNMYTFTLLNVFIFHSDRLNYGLDLGDLKGSQDGV